MKTLFANKKLFVPGDLPNEIWIRFCARSVARPFATKYLRNSLLIFAKPWGLKE